MSLIFTKEEIIYMIQFIYENREEYEFLDEDYKFKKSILTKLDNLNFNEYVEFIKALEEAANSIEDGYELNFLNMLHRDILFLDNPNILKYAKREL